VKTSWYPVRAVLNTTSPDRSVGAPKTPALEDVPVFQGEYCCGQFRLFLRGVDNFQFSR